MIRILFFAVVLSAFCRWALGKWPWEYLKSPPTRAQAVFKARKLLGVEADARHSEIREAHRRMAALVHPDRGGSNAKLAEINAARDLLLDELPNEGYDPQ